MGTTQSGDTEYYCKKDEEFKKKRHLTESDVYGAKQKTAACYAMIGIGQDKGSAIRYVDIIKKKRGTFTQVVCEMQDIYSDFKEKNW